MGNRDKFCIKPYIKAIFCFIFFTIKASEYKMLKSCNSELYRSLGIVLIIDGKQLVKLMIMNETSFTFVWKIRTTRYKENIIIYINFHFCNL